MTTFRKDQEFPSASHPICDGCEAFCCTRRFGWHIVQLTESDLADVPLMAKLKAADVLRTRTNGWGGEDKYMEIVGERCEFLADGGRCGIYSIRPVACRNVTCFSTDCACSGSPIRTKLKPWMNRLQKWNLLHHPDGRYTNRAHFAHFAHYDAIRRFYDLHVAVVKHKGSRRPEVVVRYTILGETHVVRDVDRLPTELKVHVNHVVRHNTTWREHAHRRDRMCTAKLKAAECQAIEAIEQAGEELKEVQTKITCQTIQE